MSDELSPPPPWRDGEQRERKPSPLRPTFLFGPRGYRGFVRLLDALLLAQGPIICRVLLSGRVAPDPVLPSPSHPRLVATRRTLLWHLDAPTSEALLRNFARGTVEEVLRRQASDPCGAPHAPLRTDTTPPAWHAAHDAAERAAEDAAARAGDPDPRWHDEDAYVASVRAQEKAWDALNAALTQRVHDAHHQRSGST